MATANSEPVPAKQDELSLLLSVHSPYEKMSHGEQHKPTKQASSLSKKRQQRPGKSSSKSQAHGKGNSRKQTKGVWVATEKVHGANFAFVTDGQRVVCANRKAMLDPGSNDFMGCFSTGLVKQHEPRVLALAKAVRKFVIKQNRHADVVWVFGELFGGGYPGLESPPNTVLVQHGIFYSPCLQFIAFDVAFASVAKRPSKKRPTTSKAADGPRRTYMGFLDAMTLTKAAGILSTQPLLKGSLSDCSSFDPSFNSTIPTRLGFPAVPPGMSQNLAEGIVIRPANTPEEVFMVAGKTQRGGRSMFKIKIAQFSEITDSQSGMARSRALLGNSGGAQRGGGKAGRYQAPTQVDLVWYEAAARLNGPRLDSAISKVGVLKPTDSSQQRSTKVSQIVALVLEDIEEELNDELSSLTQQQRDIVLSRCRTAASEQLEQISKQ